MIFSRTTVFLWLMLAMPGGNAVRAAEKSPSLAALKSAVSRSSSSVRAQPNRDLRRQLSSSFDAGDRYLTPDGPRKLHRLAGAFALPAEKASQRRLTTPGQPLAGYSAGKQPVSGISILSATDAERGAHIREPAKLEATLRQLRSTAEGKLANPVFIDPETGGRLLATTNLVIQLEPGLNARRYFGSAWDRVRPLSGTNNQFLLAMPGAVAEEVLAETTRRAGHPEVLWAEPDFIAQVTKLFAPDDPRFIDQWHSVNTGQWGATPGADVKLPGAWDITLGNSNVVIAIIDDGVQIDHPDLESNIYCNPGEIPRNGIDDDHNGIIDDYNGWDFIGNDRDPSPDDPEDNHGTALAGVAAAVGNNGLGVSGAAPRCRVMPLKVLRGSAFGVSSSALADVIRYAAGLAGGSSQPWRGADVISISLLLETPSLVVNAALTDAATLGRNGRGCPVFCAAGNNAEAWRPIEVDIEIPGNYTLRWQYIKDGSDEFATGADTVWLDNVTYPDGTTESFENPGLPGGWTSGGDVLWSFVKDGTNGNHAMTGWHGPNSGALRSGRIRHNERSWLEVTTFLTPGILTFWTWTESEAEEIGGELVGYDGFAFTINDFPLANDFGVPEVEPEVGYPASLANTIAVGASTDFDFRANYSQHGTALDFVVSSDGGFASITTTDRTGADGYNLDPTAGGDYTARFGGTSAATSLAAGIGALILSANPYLTATELRTLMPGTCDRIGSEPYDANDRNRHYGFGRVNATRAVSRALPNLKITVTDTPNPVVVGDTSTSTVVVRNIGSSRSGLLRVTHDLPPGVLFGSATPPPASRNGSVLTFTNAGLSGGGILTIIIVATNTRPGTNVITTTVTNDVIETDIADNTIRATTLVVPAPVLSISDVTVAEGDRGSSNALFIVSLSNPSSKTVTVRFATMSHSATSLRDFAPLSGRLTFKPGETNKTIVIRVTGDLLDEDDETFAVSLASPINATLGDSQGVGMILDNDPSPTLSIANATRTEGNSGAASVAFRLKLARTSGRTATVRFATASGSAIEGSDFVGTNGMLTFPPGKTTATIAVRIIGETSRETNEMFFLNLSDPTNAVLAATQAVGTIVNNDARPKLFIGDATVTEGADGSTNAVFNVRLVPVSGLPVSVWWFTTNGMAVTGVDFSGVGLSPLTFSPGETNQELVVPVIGDVLSESNETFFVRLLNPTNAVLADALGLGTILDDDSDSVPALTISDATVREPTAGSTNALFNVTLSTASGRMVTVKYATATNTARSRSDFIARSGTLTFPPGATNQLISVTVNRDAIAEADESFFVNLTAPVNASLQDTQAVGTILGPSPVQLVVELTAPRAAGQEPGVHLRFHSVAGQSYQVECCSDLDDPSGWRPLPGAEEIMGTGETIEIGLPAATPQCFYRVRLLRGVP